MNEKEKIQNSWEEKIYEILDNSVIFHKPTFEFLLKKKDWDALILFSFYCYCSKLQKNNKRIWVSNNFARKNLGWRKERLIKAKKQLTEYGIIRTVALKEKSQKSKGMVIKKWLIEILPLLNAESIISSVKTSEVPEPQRFPLLTSELREPQFNINNFNKCNTNKNDNKDITLLEEHNHKEITHFISLFKEVNPTYERLFRETPQKEAIKRLLKKFGKEKLEKIIKSLKVSNSIPYAPVITTPIQLERKLGELIAFWEREKAKGPKVIEI